MTNFRIHTRRSIRLKGYDYSQEGLYFITICVQDKICRFGHIENGKMIYNQYGTIAHNEWINTPNIRTNIILHEFVIMPNHIHGIIEITENYPTMGHTIRHRNRKLANTIRRNVQTNCIRQYVRIYDRHRKQLALSYADINRL